MQAEELAVLRICERAGCAFRIPDGVTTLNHIISLMTNHLAAVHPRDGGSEGGVGGKSTAAIPQLEEQISEVAWSSWLNGFNRW